MCKNDTHQLHTLRQRFYKPFPITTVLFLKYIRTLTPFYASLSVLLFDTNTKCTQFQEKQNKKFQHQNFEPNSMYVVVAWSMRPCLSDRGASCGNESLGAPSNAKYVTTSDSVSFVSL